MNAEGSYDYYQLLGVPRTATVEEIKTAYRDLAQIYHPDSNFYSEIVGDENMGMSPEQAALFKAITAAYHTLVSEESRKEYDETLCPQLKGWTETKIVIDPKVVKEAKAHKPYAYGTFGKVTKKAKVPGEEMPTTQVRPVSEMLYVEKKSFFTRLCELFGI